MIYSSFAYDHFYDLQFVCFACKPMTSCIHVLCVYMLSMGLSWTCMMPNIYMRTKLLYMHFCKSKHVLSHAAASLNQHTASFVSHVVNYNRINNYLVNIFSVHLWKDMIVGVWNYSFWYYSVISNFLVITFQSDLKGYDRWILNIWFYILVSDQLLQNNSLLVSFWN